MLQFAFLQIVIYYILLKRFIFKVTLCSILLITLINFEHGVAGQNLRAMGRLSTESKKRGAAVTAMCPLKWTEML